MILRTYIFYFKNGKMSVYSKNERMYDLLTMTTPISRWYRKNPYAKMVDENWICQDYRIDQQRPQRNVYSQAYLEIVKITDIERNMLNNFIKILEDKIDYPTVYDDGVNTYYEKTIYCPNCGERRKVLTSYEHCEFCGYEFKNAIVCPKCNGLNLKDSNECRICGHDFNEEIVEDDIVEEKYDIKDRCCYCGYLIDEDDKYCGECGMKLPIKIKCKHCGMKIKENNKYCNYCGNKL